MFITFEGIDGSGKSTQAQLLADALERLGRRVIRVREPGNTSVSEAIRAILLNETYADMTARTELLLFEAARAQLVETTLRSDLATGAIVICDRFTDSTLAYQGYGRGLSIDDVRACNRVATGGLIPDMTFYIDISLAIAKERSLLRDGAKADRMEQAGIEFYERTLNGYRELARQEPQRVIRIDGEKSVDEIHNRIYAIFLERFDPNAQISGKSS